MPKRKLKKLKRVRNVKELIAEGYGLTSHIKDLNSRLEEIKTKLREHAESVEKSFITGHNRSCVTVSDIESYSLDVRKFKKACSSATVFLNTVNVPVGKAREVLGNAKFEKLASKSVKKYIRVQFHDIDDVE